MPPLSRGRPSRSLSHAVLWLMTSASPVFEGASVSSWVDTQLEQRRRLWKDSIHSRQRDMRFTGWRCGSIRPRFLAHAVIQGCRERGGSLSWTWITFTKKKTCFGDMNWLLCRHTCTCSQFALEQGGRKCSGDALDNRQGVNPNLGLDSPAGGVFLYLARI